jgi:hypothetical protein
MEGLEQGGTPRIKHKLKMGTIDATWTTPNTLEVKTQNVNKFRVFLSPSLMDFKKPLKINVNGKPGFEGPRKIVTEVRAEVPRRASRRRHALCWRSAGKSGREVICMAQCARARHALV